MACAMTIYGAFGLSDPISGIEVTGTSLECPGAFEGENIEVTLRCETSGGTATKTTESDANGDWSVEFTQTEVRCGCADPVTISARCLSDENCPAAQLQTTVGCDDCPHLNLTPDDDVPNANVTVECEMDGNVLVSVDFNFVNTSSIILQPVLNPGPGGTVVSMDTAFVTPGGAFHFFAVCRYNPIATPNPKPFIEFLKFDGLVLMDCPPVPFVVPDLPDCKASLCPTTVIFEVTDSDGNVVIVSGPNEVLCLMPGTFTVTVVSPQSQQGLEVFWSVDNSQTNPLVTGQSFDVDLEEGIPKLISVAISVQGCPPLGGSVELETCVIDCEQDVTLELRDANGNVVGLNGDCIAPGNYTIRAVGPVEPPWDFKWTVDGQIDTNNTSDVLPITIVAGQAVSVEVEVSAPGCEDKTEDVTVSGCNTPDDNGDDDDDDGDTSFGCGALLLTALGLMVVGMIGVIVGVCTGFAPAVIGGAIVAAVGLILFGIWLVLCKSTTSCKVLNQARCVMQIAGWVFVIVAIVLSFTTGIGCGLPAFLSSLGWFAIATIITDVLVAKECSIESCY